MPAYRPRRASRYPPANARRRTAGIPGYETAAARTRPPAAARAARRACPARAARIRARTRRAGLDRTDGRRQTRNEPAARRVRLQPQGLGRSRATLRACEPATLQTAARYHTTPQ